MIDPGRAILLPKRMFSWTLVSSPSLLLLLFLTLALHVRVGLGHWPTPLLENYQTTAYRIHIQIFFWVAIPVLYASFPLWLLSLCFRVSRISFKTHLKQAFVYAAGWILVFIYVSADPWKFAEWFFD